MLFLMFAAPVWLLSLLLRMVAVSTSSLSKGDMTTAALLAAAAAAGGGIFYVACIMIVWERVPIQ